MEGPFRIETKPFVMETVEEKPQTAASEGPLAPEQPSRTTRIRRALRRFFVGD